MGHEGTVFENSPKETRADVIHELVPEIRVASRILNERETVEKLREVSQKLKSEDLRMRGKTFTSRGWVNTPVLLGAETDRASSPSHSSSGLLADDRMALSSDNSFYAAKYSGSPLRLRRESPSEIPETAPVETRTNDWKVTVRKLLCCCW